MKHDYMDSVPATVTIGKSQMPVHELLDIDQTSLSNEYAAQAARYAYVAVLCVQAREAYNEAKSEREAVEAEAFTDYKNDPESIPTGGRSVSDALADKLTKQDSEYVQACIYERDAHLRYRLLEVVMKAFEMRADMLQSMGAHLRHEAEMQGLSVREAQQAADPHQQWHNEYIDEQVQELQARREHAELESDQAILTREDVARLKEEWEAQRRHTEQMHPTQSARQRKKRR